MLFIVIFFCSFKFLLIFNFVFGVFVLIFSLLLIVKFWLIFKLFVKIVKLGLLLFLEWRVNVLLLELGKDNFE